MTSKIAARRNADHLLSLLPCVHVDRMDVAPHHRGGLEHGFEIEILLDGLDASLHRVPMRWECFGTTGEEDDIAAHLTAELALQRSRMDAAVALGLGAAGAEGQDATHMAIDAPLLGHETHAHAIVLRELEKRVRTRHAGDAVRRIVRASGMTTSVAILDGEPLDPRPRILMGVTAPWGGYDGATVRVRSDVLPSTVLAAMEGRRVDELVALPDCGGTSLRGIGGRRVLGASMSRQDDVDHANRRPLYDVDVLDLATQPEWTRLQP
jgi:hypothetical protein